MNKMIDPKAAEAHGIKLDAHGWPVKSSLEEWHRKNNPHLFAEEPKGFWILLWIVPLILIVILIVLSLK